MKLRNLPIILLITFLIGLHALTARSTYFPIDADFADSVANAITEGSLADSIIVSADIKNDVIVDADINASAAIAQSKLATLVGADEAYDSGWAADTGLAEKDDIYDYLHLIDTDDDGSLTDESWFTTFLADYCLESVFGDAIEADDFVKTGTTLTLQAEIPHIDATQTWTAVQTLADFSITKRTSAPTPVAGTVYYVDETNWDPAGLGIGKAYYVIYDGAAYIPLFDEDGDWYLNKIQAAMNVDTKAAAYTLTAADMNSVFIMTAAGDVDILADQCDTATGIWITVKSSAAHSNSIDFLDAADDFYLSDGSLVDGAANELVLAGAAGSQVTLMCLQANKWWITGEIGTCTSKADD